jgi:L-alanine-DL-glutamate epimerase-like enolase superfamily enzyme
VCPHFLMELHVALCCAVPNSRWVEYIPQLDELTHSPTDIREGRAYASTQPGLGIDWNWARIEKMQLAKTITLT